MKQWISETFWDFNETINSNNPKTFNKYDRVISAFQLEARKVKLIQKHDR